MSFAGNIISKIRSGEASMTSLLLQYASPPSRPVDEHDLAELSPRPEHALLADESPDNGLERGSSSVLRKERMLKQPQGKGDGVGMKASVAFREPPWSFGRARDNTAQNIGEEMPYHTREENDMVSKTWRPSFTFTSEDRPPQAGSTRPQQSFFETMFSSRPAYTERSHSMKLDQSFKLIERRERQMQQELQHLLNAQDYALEKHLANTAPADDDDDGTTQRSGTPVFDNPNGHVIPVRQPKKRHLSKREARLGISRCMSQLSDLKNEEEAYIATALAERKAALSRLRNLSSKRNSILAGMKSIESEHDQPYKNEIGKMERKHQVVCEEILKLEERLNDLKRTKTRLENRIAEAKSTRDSELSGYKGALNECDKRISDIMNYPEVSVLEVEGLMSQDTDLRALAGQHISGLEFLSLRPERRTLPMAKDWWEGEIQVLELRKTAVDRERGALDEGTQLWHDMVDRLEAYDQQLTSTFNAMSEYSSKQRHRSSKFNELGEILKKQYTLSKDMIHELEELYEYAEAQGWKLLMTALGAEINYFYGLKTQLGDTLNVVGWADGVVTPPTGTTNAPSRDDDLLTNNDDEALTRRERDLDKGRERAEEEDEDITGSILRRWDGTDEQQIAPTSPSNPDTSGLEITPREPHNNNHDDDDDTNNSDNEVPHGLLSEAPVTHEDDDDERHNDIPPEFLSMHSPARAKTARSEPSAEGEDGEHEHNEEEENEKHHPLSRESSANEVPPDLLSESRRTLD
ncbi:hypothetical protein F5B22DRAFT_515126 [Xylaria bambusicola]|uniref:uncharacterized protein n=1 Tax=Xylaria bambusicola TaxID=326684 RepID=UPI0020089BDA|nr:uncharacterized protein F5B22DRAFT_515126 [Xylaria bambusicola]KAI0505604.1 hypothetical protein F5B22DRAFT_515126 [Xylaria bambusicola]